MNQWNISLVISDPFPFLTPSSIAGSGADHKLIGDTAGSGRDQSCVLTGV